MEQFRNLEENVRLAAQQIQHLKKVRIELEQQVDTLQTEKRGLQKRVTELEAGHSEQAAVTEELDRLRAERSDIRQRVDTLVNELAGLGLEEDQADAARPGKRKSNSKSKKGTPAQTAASG